MKCQSIVSQSTIKAFEREKPDIDLHGKTISTEYVPDRSYNDSPF